jgi:hypothetical protein
MSTVSTQDDVRRQTGSNQIAVRPFHVDVSDDALEDLRHRITATRWPSKELVPDRSH